MASPNPDSPQPPPFSMDGIPVFDRAQALRAMGDDEDLLKEIAGLYLADYPGSLHLLQSALKAGDASVAERLAHSLKGASANLGAERVRAVAYEIEKAARSGDLGRARHHLAGLEVEGERFCLELRGLPGR